MTNDRDHHAAVNEFFHRIKEENPERYEEVMQELGDYPVMTSQRHRTVRSRERSVGLLGVAAAYIAPAVANQYGFESVYQSQEDA